MIRPTAPLFWPMNFSPITKSVVLPDGPFNDVSVILGALAVVVSVDSKIPWILTISASFKTILSSWTLVPIGKSPKVKPSFKVVAPIPDAASLE